MKGTTKIVLGIVGVLVLVVIALAIGARVVVGNVLSSGSEGDPIELSGTRIERSFDVRDFSAIDVRGGWQIAITEGDSYSVTVSADEALMERIIVERDGDALRVDADRWRWSNEGRLRLEVTTPRLSRIDVDGGADVRLSGLRADSLRIGIDGAGNITGTDSRIERLAVEVDGAANVDFVESSVVHADIRMSGAGNVEITMAGGELTGRIEGVGSVGYGGEVSRRTIRVDGLGSVERR
ncbi:MAG: GIN domain-containing protein [Spirochaetaceae bacterium]